MARIRASIAIPGIFCPVEIDDLVLVDGGVVDESTCSSKRWCRHNNCRRCMQRKIT